MKVKIFTSLIVEDLESQINVFLKNQVIGLDDPDIKISSVLKNSNNEYVVILQYDSIEGVRRIGLV